MLKKEETTPNPPKITKQDYSVILSALNEVTIKGKDSIYFSQLLLKVQALTELAESNPKK